MKGKNKLASLLMAGIVAWSCVPVPNGEVLAAQVKSEEGALLTISGNDVTKTLEKGDRFTLYLKAEYTGESKDLKKIIQYIDLSGSVKASFSADEVQITENSIIIMDLVYNGEKDFVEVKVDYQGSPNNTPATTQITLSNASPQLSASEGITVSQNIINVVAGENQQITLTVNNNSGKYVKEGKMKLKMKESTTSKGINIKKKDITLSSMSKGEKKDYYVTLDIDKDVTRGLHEMLVDIEGTVHTVKLKVDSNFMPPALEVSVSNTSAFEENVAKPIQVAIKNVGHVAAKNVKLEIVPNEKVFIADGSNVKYIENIDSNKAQTIPVSLIVGDTSSFNLPVEMKLSYIDDLGETKTSSQVVYLSTKGSVAQKELEIVTTSEPQGIKKVGDTFSIGFKVSAPSEAKNVKLSVKSTEGIVSKSKSMFIEPKLAKGSTKSYTVDFVATQGVTTGTYPIEIVAEYVLNGKEVAIKQYATVSIDNPKESDEEKAKGKPKVIVGTYNSNPVVVKAGEEFDLEIGFLNTHQDKTVKNLKANLTVKEQGENDTGSVFTPVGASNTFFINELAPGQMDVKNIRLYTIPSAKPKTYQITLEMEYEDNEGEAITATENFGIPVEQVTKLEVAEVRVEQVEVGMPTELTATIYNTGKTSISNVRIKTVGEGFEVEDNTLIIGSLDKGASKTYMPTIIPMQGGQLTGQIVIEYEDITGEIKNYTHDFQMDVMESMPMEPEPMPDDMLPPMEEEKEAKWPILLGMFLGMGIAAGITVIVNKKRRRKLEEMDLDED
nr:CARDB domain-containing protein [uncultured Niameybacter sp.]